MLATVLAAAPAGAGAPRARGRAGPPSAARSRPRRRRGPLGEQFARQVEGEAVGVVQLEDVLRGDPPRRRRRAPARSSTSSSRVPCASVRPKLSSSEASHFSIASRCARPVRGRRRPSARARARRSARGSPAPARAAALLDRAAHHAAQHVAALLVGGHDAVGDQERHRRASGRRGSAARGRWRSPRRSAGRRAPAPSSISGWNWSVSNTDSFSCRIAAMRLRPRPVSMLRAGSSLEVVVRAAGRTA